MTRPAWDPTLTALLADEHRGAELTVTDLDGQLVHRCALARHHRHESSDPPILWIRPLNDGYPVTDRRPGEPAHRFSLNTTRRRALSYITAASDGDEIRLRLANGQHATIRPIHDDLRPQLDAWDTFTALVLPAQTELDLDRLEDDSWHGEWA
jgi:hypothetical protein